MPALPILTGLLAFIRVYGVRAAGQRYRILYRVIEADFIVAVAFVEIRRQRDRRDVYRLAEKLVRRGLL